MSEQESQKNPQEPQFSLVDIVSTNNTIDNSIFLLRQTNPEIIDLLITSTPENLRGEINFKILNLVKSFLTDIDNLLSQPK